MRIVITGATGFLGRQLVEALRDGHELTAVVRKHDPGLPGNVEQIVADLATQLVTSRLPAHADGVIHLAQSPFYRDFPDHAADIFQVNVAATAALLEYARTAGVRSFALASSGAVYPPGMSELNEAAPLSPQGYYPMSKYASELLSAPYADMFSIAVLRCFFLYGPGQQPDRFLPSLVARVREGRPIFLEGGDSGMVCAPTEVADAAAVFREAIEQDWHGTFNVASPYSCSVRDLASGLGDVLDRSPVFESRPGPAPRFVPCLDRLAAVYDVGSMRSVRADLARLCGPGVDR